MVLEHQNDQAHGSDSSDHVGHKDLAGQYSVTELVAAARAGDEAAWATLVSRYEPLIRSVARRFRLSNADAEDVRQTVWLQLVTNLERLREPRAMPGWIETATTYNCLLLLKTRKRMLPQDPELFRDVDLWRSANSVALAEEVEDAQLAEQNRDAVHRGLAELSEKQQRLLALLAVDPPLSYQEISDRLGMPVGSIGPTRARSLEKLRRTDPVRSVLADERSAIAA